jgi:hypothetical protein
MRWYLSQEEIQDWLTAKEHEFAQLENHENSIPHIHVEDSKHYSTHVKGYYI